MDDWVGAISMPMRRDARFQKTTGLFPLTRDPGADICNNIGMQCPSWRDPARAPRTPRQRQSGIDVTAMFEQQAVVIGSGGVAGLGPAQPTGAGRALTALTKFRFRPQGELKGLPRKARYSSIHLQGGQ